MDERAAAALAYIPLPGVAWLFPRTAPRSRLVRYHARQGGVFVLALYVLLILVGLVGRAAPGAETALGIVSGFLLFGGLAGLAIGASSAATGRFHRIRPVWDALAR